MHDQQNIDEFQTVVLVVPDKHVKTIKTALEQIRQLDRSSKIALEAPQGSDAAPLLQSADITRPQILEFDLHSGEYVDRARIERRGPANSAAPSSGQPDDIMTVATLQFDQTSGEYVDTTSTGKQSSSGTQPPSQSQNINQFPILQFDLASGEYVDPAVLAQRDQESQVSQESRMRIPTTIPYLEEEGQMLDFKLNVLDKIGLPHLFDEISISHQSVRTREAARAITKNPLHKALQESLETLSQAALTSLNLTTESLVASMPDSYSAYKPMLLLSHGAFSSTAWTTLLSAHPFDSDLLQPVWKRMAEAVGATHIAINSPIPLHTISTSTQSNVLRSPVNLRPIYGDFGPPPSAQTLSAPSQSDFDKALWVSTIQNGIHQTWAPLFTMFSRGNIREKTRILNLPTVATDFDVPSSAIDMYAGVGYFAFSYKKAGSTHPRGITKVLGWELNPWSVEGLRRGAALNGWTCQVIRSEDMPGLQKDWASWRPLLEGADFWIFQMSNEHAEDTLGYLGAVVPPVRHVNLGLLPSSEASWRGAVGVLDARRGGWVHVHENVGTDDVNARAGEIEKAFQALLDDRESGPHGRRARVEHVERVKMYAPGVVHCVFDTGVNGE